jgi:hypothetical protein
MRRPIIILAFAEVTGRKDIAGEMAKRHGWVWEPCPTGRKISCATHIVTSQLAGSPVGYTD